jgi:hypothetical protein
MAEWINICSIRAQARKVLDRALGGGTGDSDVRETKGGWIDGRESQANVTSPSRASHVLSTVPSCSPFTDVREGYARLYWNTHMAAA